MKLWLSRNSDVPLRKQLSTQLILGIVSADLSAGERLPSSSQLSRRFHIHPNTVRSVYRDLVKNGWAEWKKGSGFYVRSLNSFRTLPLEKDLDQMISKFLQDASKSGYSLSEIRSRLTEWFPAESPERIVVVEPDPELCRILVNEVANAVKIPVSSILGFGEIGRYPGALFVALYDNASPVNKNLPAQTSCLFLHSRSVPKTLDAQSRPEPGELITVVSGWRDFLVWAKTMLVSTGIDPEVIELRHAQSRDWKKGLAARKYIITDSSLAESIPVNCKPLVFQVISDESLQELNMRLQNSTGPKNH